MGFVNVLGAKVHSWKALFIQPASAHGDTEDGPAVQDARRELETGNVNHALKWVHADGEDQVRAASDATPAPVADPRPCELDGAVSPEGQLVLTIRMPPSRHIGVPSMCQRDIFCCWGTIATPRAIRDLGATPTWSTPRPSRQERVDRAPRLVGGSE